ncbi:MAG: DUF2059 domain-containing protein [Pseudomonas sp.]|uniref:DUF2059 domain-containing protein n=1 Tax=Pseudomonas sp. TaxID=306 RepID=UPI003397B983
MRRLNTLCVAVLLACTTGLAQADAKSHAADAERVLKLAGADKRAVPLYAQVQSMFAQRFAQAQGPESKKALLESYQAKGNAALDKAVGWDKLKPDLITLYTKTFSEQELKDLIAFYESPLGKKMLTSMPALTEQSAKMAQARLEATGVPEVNKLLADMTAELQPAAKPAAKP